MNTEFRNLTSKTVLLKSLSFLFEYIGEMGKDYIYAVTSLLEDALMDRDLVHRQTACAAIKHMAIGVYGFGCESAMVHLLNYVWPNIFETSPHLVQAFMDSIEGLIVALGPQKEAEEDLQKLGGGDVEMKETLERKIWLSKRSARSEGDEPPAESVNDPAVRVAGTLPPS
ncbi:Splicing factor 3B subunit 1-like 2 [Homarus americanus]|uniref:Splicing factor 3B subunit 1-like 1 n=1 Tax=Homarus americanus TaxID=6706 RepID=A0A8J5JCR2_HOMAM|nr:Splicing factor 3B subunit 1-like 1 [Homarus americanus]KAG7171395.1 Splicing factor 3B subunit 1-like 2 [Homarus americanus]